jgi:hypothetical protein
MSAKEKAEGKAKVKKINRATATNRVLSEMTGATSLSELAAKADGLVVASGGESDLKATAHAVKRGLETMEAVGIVKLTRPTDIMVERTKGNK